MGLPIIGDLLESGMKLASKFITDKDKLAEYEAAFKQSLLSHEQAIIDTQASVIQAEAQGDSWLQRNWRPIVMLFLTGLVGAHWLGFTAPNITDTIVSDMLGIVQVGLGGYVVGRSGEKIMQAYKANEK